MLKCEIKGKEGETYVEASGTPEEVAAELTMLVYNVEHSLPNGCSIIPMLVEGLLDPQMQFMTMLEYARLKSDPNSRMFSAACTTQEEADAIAKEADVFRKKVMAEQAAGLFQATVKPTKHNPKDVINLQDILKGKNNAKD